MAPPPAYPGFAFELSNYAGKMRALSTVWFIYGGLALAAGLAGHAFSDAWLAGRMGPGGHH